jgi:hypothetical protein
MLDEFYEYRQIFQVSGVRPTGFSLPRQHSLSHYCSLIKLFAAPNGLCTSITETKHIRAVKEPWRRSNKHNALGQILLTNQRLDKLTHIRSHLESCRLLAPTTSHSSASEAGVHERRNDGSERASDEDPNSGVVPGPTFIGKVRLPNRGGECIYGLEPTKLTPYVCELQTIPSRLICFLLI